MNLIEICIAFIVAIVSIGTPLVFQVISKFEEKYQSEKIVELFKKDSNFWLLKALIVITPVFVLSYILSSFLLVNTNNELYSNLLRILSFVLLFTTIVLISQFIYFSFKVLKFSSPSTFIKTRINYLKKSKDRIELEDNIIVVTNFFLYSIQKEFVDTCTLIPNYFFYVFLNYREKIRNDNEQFPAVYYDTVHLITYELVLSKSIRLKKLDHFASGFHWLVGSVEEAKITDDTYNRLWSNLSLITMYGNDNMIFEYWKLAVHHFDYNLRTIYPDYKTSESVEYSNQSEINTRNKERSEFINFHYYLGGLLLYKNRIESIRKIWDHTTSEPPRYSLLPSTLDDIFYRYFEFCSIFDQKLWEKTARFKFPEIDSINFDWISHRWIRKYLILLFIRQYTLNKYFTYQEFLKLPRIPVSQAEKSHWIENIQGFKSDLKEILTDNKLLKILRLDYISREWCIKSEKIFPLELIEKFETKLEIEFEISKVNQFISPEKESKFWESSKILISEALKEYSTILNQNKPKETLNNLISIFYISGARYITPKSDFADNQEYEHFNYDSIVAESLSNKIRYSISETFLYVSSQSYLLKENDLFPAIDRIIFEDNADQFVIICFQLNLKYFRNVLNVKELSTNKYKNIDLVDIWNCNNQIVGNSIFILYKSDLPTLSFKEPISKLKEEYKKEEIIFENIYTTVIDLNQRSDIKGILKKENTYEDLEDKVLVSIEMNAEIQWNKNTKVISLRVTSGSGNEGLSNKLEEVKPFVEI